MAALLPSVTAIRKRPFLHLKRPRAQEGMLPTAHITYGPSSLSRENGPSVNFGNNSTNNGYFQHFSVWKENGPSEYKAYLYLQRENGPLKENDPSCFAFV